MNQITIQIDKTVIVFYKQGNDFTGSIIKEKFTSKDMKTIKRLVQKSMPTACAFEFSVTPVSMDFLEVNISFF